MSYAITQPLCRAHDPLTSFEAADVAKKIKASQERSIIAVLEAHGPMGVDAIGDRCNMNGHQVGKRVTLLGRQGRIMKTGKCVVGHSGSRQQEWSAI